MSFHEKSTAAMLGGTILVYGWYFFEMIEVASSGLVSDGPVGDGQIGGSVAALEAIGPALATTIGLIIVFAIVAHLAIVAYEKGVYGDVSDQKDERDTLIDLKSEGRAGAILSLGVVVSIGMLLMGNGAFLVANTLLAALVLSEIVKGVSKLLGYRRGV